MDDKLVIKSISIIGILESFLFVLLGVLGIYAGYVILNRPNLEANVPFLNNYDPLALYASIFLSGLSFLVGLFGVHSFYKIYNFDEKGIPRVFAANLLYCFIFFVTFGVNLFSDLIAIILIAELWFIYQKRSLFS